MILVVVLSDPVIYPQFMPISDRVLNPTIRIYFLSLDQLTYDRRSRCNLHHVLTLNSTSTPDGLKPSNPDLFVSFVLVPEFSRRYINEIHKDPQRHVRENVHKPAQREVQAQVPLLHI